jgi:hypothetical protein
MNSINSLLDFIPPSSSMLSEDAGIELEPFQASAFGNCFWCSLSIHLTGNERRQNFLRLASALNAVINERRNIDKVQFPEDATIIYNQHCIVVEF